MQKKQPQNESGWIENYKHSSQKKLRKKNWFLENAVRLDVQKKMKETLSHEV